MRKRKTHSVHGLSTRSPARKDKTFIPVDAVSRVLDREVLMDRTREQIAGAPEYDPDLTDARSYYEDVYGHYGLSPYWSPGYVYPGHLYYPR